jgi:hypothetical protein
MGYARFARFVTLASLLFFWTSEASPAPTANSAIYPQNVRGPVAQIVPGSGTSGVAFITPGTNVGQNGTKIIGIVCSNTDAAAGYAIQLIKVRSSVNYIMNTVWVPASAGNSASSSAYVPPVSLMPPGYPIDTAGNAYIIVEGSAETSPANSDTLTIASTTTVNTGKIVACSATASDL